MLGQLINHYFQLSRTLSFTKPCKASLWTALHMAPEMDTLWATSAASRALSRAKTESLNQGPQPSEEVTLPCKEVKPETEPLSLLLLTVLASLTGCLTGLNAPR